MHAILLLLPFLGFQTAFGQLSGTQHFPPIAEMLGSAAVSPLPDDGAGLKDSLSSAPTFEQSIRELTSANEARRRDAVRRLGKKGSLKAIPYLGAVLLRTDADPKTRADAAMSIGRIGSWKGLAILEESLGDPSVNVRFASALAVGKIPAADSVPLLEDSALNDSHWWVRYAAAVALGDSGNPAALPILSRMLASDLRWQVRQQAARSITRFQNPVAVASLGKALSDMDASVRYSAARALGDMGSLDALDHLHAALEKERDPMTRTALHSSLDKIVRN